MSRYIKKIDENREFIYGHDHVLGYFYEIWDYSRGEEDYECLLEDKSSMFGRLSREQMAKKMEENGVKKDHIQSVALDLPF
jgi:hypothetical protein